MAVTSFNNALVSNSLNAQKTLVSLLVSTFIMSAFFKCSMNLLLSFLNQLLLVIHLPMFRIIIPGNVITVFEMIIPIYTFDILDPSYTTELLFEFDEHAD